MHESKKKRGGKEEMCRLRENEVEYNVFTVQSERRVGRYLRGKEEVVGRG